MIYTGLTAKLSLVDGSTETEIGYVSNFKVEENRDYIELTKLGSKNKEKLPAGFSWTASADGAVDFSAGSAHQSLRQAMIDGQKVQVKFALDSTTFLKGEAFVEALSVDVTSDDKSSISISLTGVGELSLTPTSAV